MRMEHHKVLTVKILNTPGLLGQLGVRIGEAGGLIGDIKVLRFGKDYITRDISVLVKDQNQLKDLLALIQTVEGVELQAVKDRVFDRHQAGKIRTTSTVSVDSPEDLRDIYTPGVARVCWAIHDEPELAREYTTIHSSVAIVTNGTAVLGLGDIGPVAGMPVMEGKAVLLDKLVGLSGVPILVDSHDPQVVIETVVAIAPTFGAINLEDIRSPECFIIEEELQRRLPIPVMHDDQHGTAVVVLAGLLNACRYVEMDLHDAVVGQIGLGAAGTGIASILSAYGVKALLGMDVQPDAVERFERLGGGGATYETVMAESDIIVATTGMPGLIKPADIRPGQVVLALTNPVPEIEPDEALAAGARFAADGKSVNNVLGFPGLFKGVLMARAPIITSAMKVAAAQAIASLAEEGELVPAPLNLEVHRAVTGAVLLAASEDQALDISDILV
ncbi:NAD-dependent malic enzyme [Nitrospinae bacterium AH_259_B05_G02_I21]|nr:NAD-dependent malic enzyme [Nitrospinae bacterium AH_259_B05_G02_I21]